MTFVSFGRPSKTLERSTRFTAVPGWGTVIMGATALAAAGLASVQSSSSLWLAVWLGDAVLAASIALVAMQRKAQRCGLPLTSGPARSFAFSFLPPVFAGAVLTPALYRFGGARLLPGVWLLLYGAGVITGGAFSVPLVPIMGVGFLLTGISALAFSSHGNLHMALGFGVLHIVFGIFIVRRHGG